MNEDWPTIPDETPIDPSGLLPKVKGTVRNHFLTALPQISRSDIVDTHATCMIVRFFLVC